MSDEATDGRLVLSLYRALWTALSPIVPLALRARAKAGKEDTPRLAERWGHASQNRPRGDLVWVHGASVGECLAALPLIEHCTNRANTHVLMTSGTVTSARLMAQRLPHRAIHQFVPLDLRGAVKTFLEHWRPNLALFVESELWPNLVLETQAAGIRVGLINARMSDKSYRGWARVPKFAKRVFGAFDVCLAQDMVVAERLKELGARHVEISGSLKADAPPLPVDENILRSFSSAIAGRPVLLAASTHPGEEDIIMDVAARLGSELHHLLTIIVPRHPERGAEIGQLADMRGLATERRSNGSLPSATTRIYVGDTLGELGLFYRIANFAFMGGSLVPHGGQNPLEATILGRAVLAGPHTDNFRAMYSEIFKAQGMGRVASGNELKEQVSTLLADPVAAKRTGERAKATTQHFSGALERTITWVERLLERPHASA